MFILSIKSLKFKLFILIFTVISAVIVFAAISSSKDEQADDSPAAGTINYSAETDEERMSFISQTGYTVKSEPLSVCEIIIPQEFDEVYEQYNNIQLDSGFDLSHYSGCTVKKWVYTVTNYPEHENSDDVHLTLLIYKGKVIGGDVCSVELDGFMHSIFS